MHQSANKNTVLPLPCCVVIGTDTSRDFCRCKRIPAPASGRAGGSGPESHVVWLSTWSGVLAQSHPVASANRRPEGPAIPQPRAQPWDCPRPTGGGLKGRVRLPLQGKGNVGGWIPRAAPWAEIGRAFGAGGTPAEPPRTGWRSRAAGRGRALVLLPFHTVRIFGGTFSTNRPSARGWSWLI